MMEYKMVCDAAAAVLGADRSMIRPDSVLSDDLGADSLDVYEILVMLGEKNALDLTGLSFSTPDITIAELAKMLENAGKENTALHA